MADLDQKVLVSLSHPVPEAAPGLRHEAMLYADDRQYADQLVRFLDAGLAAGEPAFVAVPGPHVRVLRDALDSRADRVRFADMSRLGRNPGRIIPAIRDFLDEHAGRRTRFVGEPIWSGRTSAEVAEATRHEALINLAFADYDTHIVCPYDVERLGHDVLADAGRTHPTISAPGRRSDSAAWTDPLQLCEARAWPLKPPPPAAEVSEQVFSDLFSLRAPVTRAARSAGLDDAGGDTLLLAVTELCTNTLRHAPGAGMLRIWTEGPDVVCEVEDGGTIADPLAGRHRAPADAETGRGLFLVNQLCDLVQLRSDAHGTTVRVRVGNGRHGTGAR
ncbi:MAG: MEDS domain-containing protein [Actinomycetota bacterium]|nr:MEDS domain-containing protein [Actinomycetota bacterium]